MTYRVDFNRTGDLTATLNGVTVKQSAKWIGIVCAEFLAANPDAEDGEVQFWDDGAGKRKVPMKCMTHPSLRAAAASLTAPVVHTPRKPAEDRKSLLVTVKQQEAFKYLLTNNMRKWNALHGKTTGSMVRSGWVLVNAKGKPEITPAGASAAAEYGISA